MLVLISKYILNNEYKEFKTKGANADEIIKKRFIQMKRLHLDRARNKVEIKYFRDE